MSILKAHEVDAFLDRLPGDAPPFCVMAYGPDRGRVSDAIGRFCAAVPVDSSDALATVTLDGPAIAVDPGRLWDELNGPGLFGGGRLVRLREVGGDKRIADTIAALLADPPAGTHLAIEAGDLKRTQALVKAFERARHGIALPCYADDERTLDRLVARSLEAAGLAIEPDARIELLAQLGGDRRATMAEIEKLALYAHGTGTVTLEDVRAATGDASGLSADEAVDAALGGEGARLECAYAKLIAARVSPFLVLRDLAQQMQFVERAHDGAGGNAARRIEAVAGRRVHFRRLPALKRAAGRLDAATARRLASRTADTVLATRLKPDLEAELVRALLHEVAGRGGT